MASNPPTGNTGQFTEQFSVQNLCDGAAPTGSANNSVQIINEKAGLPRLSDAMGEWIGRKKRVLLWGAIAALAAVVIAVAVAVPVVLTSRNKDDSSDSSNNGGSGGGNRHDGNGNNTPQGSISGGDGSEVTMEDGTTFTYVNKFGGYWVSDPADPFNNGAKANEWTPALNETWNWNTNRIFG